MTTLSAPEKPPRRWLCCDIALIGYVEALDLQRALAAARKADAAFPDVVLLLEHPPVFTLGKRGGREFLHVSEDFLRARGVPVVAVERGGVITYHGPGQVVGYPIVDIRAAGIGVGDLVHGLEEVMIRCAADFGVTASRDSRNRGVWAGKDKLGSIGLAVSRWVTLHGFALNVSTDLEPFTWAAPCGLDGVRMTSLERVSGARIPMAAAHESVRRHIEAVFSTHLTAVALPEIRAMLPATSEDQST